MQLKFESQTVTKSTSCSNLRSLWEAHMAQTNNNNNNNNVRACPQPLNISPFQESFTKSSNFNQALAQEIFEGELTKDAFKFFTESRSRVNPDDPNADRPRPSNSSAIAALRESLMTSSSSSSRAKVLFDSGALSNGTVQRFSEQRSGE